MLLVATVMWSDSATVLYRGYGPSCVLGGRVRMEADLPTFVPGMAGEASSADRMEP